MSFNKRKHDDDPSYKKRSRGEVNAPVDPTYGQRSAIPGLDDDTRGDSDGDSLNYDEDLDALAYLRAVRLVPPPIHITKTYAKTSLAR